MVCSSEILKKKDQKMDNKLEHRLVDEKRNEYICTDKDGNTSQYVMYKGHKFYTPAISCDIKERFDAVANFPGRDDDILIMTLPKSGTHWLTNIVFMVMNGNTEYKQTMPVLEYIDFEPMKSMESPRLLQTHLTFPFIPSELKRNKSKILTIFRDPRDVMTSFYTYQKKLLEETSWFHGNWDTFFNFYMSKEVVCETWFEHIKMWEQAHEEFPDKEVLFLSYEDMKANLYENVKRINKFLGFGRSDEFCREVATRCTFLNMKNNLHKETGGDPNWTILAKDGVLPAYRKGEIGDWKNWFTVAQSEIFDKIYEQEMKDFDMTVQGPYSL